MFVSRLLGYRNVIFIWILDIVLNAKHENKNMDRVDGPRNGPWIVDLKKRRLFFWGGGLYHRHISFLILCVYTRESHILLCNSKYMYIDHSIYMYD